MKKEHIEALRHSARKVVRELGMLDLDPKDKEKTPGYWHALIEIDKEPGITISALGRLLLMTLSTISRLVKTLAGKGFVELKAGSDKREKSLFLTAKGKEEVGKINAFSDSKIIGAFQFLSEDDVKQIIGAFGKYGEALEKSRAGIDSIKIATLPTSRTIRKQIISMIEEIQKIEFSIPVTKEMNLGILKAEEEYHYNRSYNFWYAVNDEGKVVGSIGLKRIDDRTGEIKKLFVVKEYRGKGVAQKLMDTLLKAASKHHFDRLYLGTVSKLEAAHRFYEKYGFSEISKKDLPQGFEINPLDNKFFRLMNK